MNEFFINKVDESVSVIRAAKTTKRVILISTELGSFITKKAALVGAKGFVPKDDVAKSLLLAIETVYQGETFFVEWPQFPAMKRESG
jgi:DNA-binding NarL/FixJ family response regulator